MQEGMTIGQLAHAAGVNVETIRYYQRRRLIAEPRKPPGGHRRYSAAALSQIHFIRRAQQLGFTLDEVEKLLGMADGRRCKDAQQLAEAKLEVLELRIEQMRRTRRELQRLIAACRDNDGRKPCPLITELLKPERS